MTLIEKMAADAFDHAYNHTDNPPLNEESYEDGYVAGFRAAREMASGLVCEHDNPEEVDKSCCRLKFELRSLGESEVLG